MMERSGSCWLRPAVRHGARLTNFQRNQNMHISISNKTRAASDRNMNWQMAIKKKCHMAALHALYTHLNEDVPELRKKIVHLALFQ